MPNAILESPITAENNDFNYLFINLSYVGEFYRIGSSPISPWQPPISFQPGWAREIWQDMEGTLFTSYLTDLTKTIDLLSWYNVFYSPGPYIGSSLEHTFIPLLTKP